VDPDAKIDLEFMIGRLQTMADNMFRKLITSDFSKRVRSKNQTSDA